MDDLEFIQNCVKPDEASWNEFLNKYSRLIYSYIRSVLNVKGLRSSQDDIADIFQDIICSLIKDNFKKLRTFQGRNGCSLASWLRQITINSTIDYTRRLRPHFSIDEENDEGFSLKEILTDDSISVKDKLSYEEKANHLKDCIGRLNNEEKYFIELHINRGVSLEELKEHLEISRPAIDMRKSRIIDKLKECFRSKGFRLEL